MRSSTRVVAATIVGGAFGLAVGATLALFRVPIPAVVIVDVSLTPSVTGLAVGLIEGFLVGLMRSRPGSPR